MPTRWKMAVWREYQLFKVPMTKLTRKAVEGLGLSQKEADRCRNFFAMGLVYWLYGREPRCDSTVHREQVRQQAQVAQANLRALQAGRNYGETTDAFVSSFQVDRAELPPGTYRNMTGNQALAWGMVDRRPAQRQRTVPGSYPITPASDILHELSKFKNFGVRTFQAEDEIAAMTSTIGAAFGGAMAITTSSGPGHRFEGRGDGSGRDAGAADDHRQHPAGWPSTGLPTKTEQSDLFQAMFGRNGECPLPVLAARSPADCFDVAQEAWRIAVRFMTPVVLLSDGYIANGSEPWRIPDLQQLPTIPIEHPGPQRRRRRRSCPTHATNGWRAPGRFPGPRV